MVVARDRPELFGYFERVFAGMPEIKVLLDRRILPPGAKPGASSDPSQQDAAGHLRRAPAARLRDDPPGVNIGWSGGVPIRLAGSCPAFIDSL